MTAERDRGPGRTDEPTGPADPPTGARRAAEVHRRVLADLAAAGDWWDGAARRAVTVEARAAAHCRRCDDRRAQPGVSPDDRHPPSGVLPAAAVEVVHRVVNDSGRLTRAWAQRQVDQLGDAPYAELVGVTAMVVALDVYARSIGQAPYELPPPVDGPPAAERPPGVGDVGAWVPMTEEKLLANVTRALSLVPRTNATWRALVTESYSRGPEMLELTWDRSLTRPQVELVAARVSTMQECFY